MRKSLAVLCLALLTITPATAADEPKFVPGQKWTIKDSTMTIVVGTVEAFAGEKTAVSVSVFDVPCPPAAGCVTTNVAHAPFDAEALAASVDKLAEQRAPLAKSYEEGYANWRNARGGIFSIPVMQLPELLFKTLPAKPKQGI